MNQRQSQIDFITVVSVGSTQFENLIKQTLNKQFFNSIQSLTKQIETTSTHLPKKPILKNKVIIQIGHSKLNLSHEIVQNLRLISDPQDTLDEAVKNFISGSTNHLHLAYSTHEFANHDPPLQPHHLAQIEIVIFRFSTFIDSLLSISHLVITHAGAGSILASIKPNTFLVKELDSKSSIPLTNDYDFVIHRKDGKENDSQTHIETFKQLIIVPNQILMDNHQIDLANEISSLGIASTCAPRELVQTIRKIQSALSLSPESRSSSALNHQHINSNPSKFKNFLDRHVGFSTPLD